VASLLQNTKGKEVINKEGVLELLLVSSDVDLSRKTGVEAGCLVNLITYDLVP